MSDLIRRDEAMRVLKDDWDASFSREDFERAQICQFHFMKISNIPTAQPKEYVKDGTLTVQMPTIKEAKAIDKIVVYADTYKQEYYMPLPKVGKWIRIGYDIYECSECHQYVKTSDIDAYDWCHHCGAKMEGANDE